MKDLKICTAKVQGRFGGFHIVNCIDFNVNFAPVAHGVCVCVCVCVSVCECVCVLLQSITAYSLEGVKSKLIGTSPTIST